jgi:hypothetical protein
MQDVPALMKIVIIAIVVVVVVLGADVTAIEIAHNARRRPGGANLVLCAISRSIGTEPCGLSSKTPILDWLEC